MTVADTSLITPSNLGYFVLEASDLGAWREFAVGVIGMQEAPAANPDVLALRLDARAQRIVINQGAEDDMQAVGWEFDNAESLQLMHAQLTAAGVDIKRGDEALCRARKVRMLYFCMDPNGLQHEFYCGPAMAPMDEPNRSANGSRVRWRPALRS